MIQTINGKIHIKDYDNILIHEHIRCASYDMLHAVGKRWLDEDYLVSYASDVLKRMCNYPLWLQRVCTGFRIV